jgi:formate hydrogenlyase transcriptional activator
MSDPFLLQPPWSLVNSGSLATPSVATTAGTGAHATNMAAPDTNEQREETAILLQFEILVADISARFLRTLPQDVEGEIDGALKNILEFFDADICALWCVDPEANAAFLSHSQLAVSLPLIPEKFNLGPSAPWLTANTARGNVTLMHSLDELPAQAEPDRLWNASLGVRTFLLLPVKVGGTVRYALQLAYTRRGPAWLAEYVPRLRLLSEVLVSALERSRGVVALQQAEARLSLAAGLAGAGLWHLDLETNMHWATARARELYGFGPEEPITLERLLAVVHPEDVPGLRRALSLAIEGERVIRTEYRVVLPSGEVRWLAVQGARSPASFAGGTHLLGVSIDITERKKLEETAKRSFEEIKRLNELLQDETRYLRNEISLGHSHGEIVGRSDGIRTVLQKVEQVAPTNATVLIMGETGTGKELVARAIHGLSGRRERLLVKVDCASLPSTLIESELFGRARGAYTGALTKQIGRFQLADKGTIFLDEIGELGRETQAKLLRVLQEGCFEVLGNPRTVKVDVRVIAATNRDLEKEVREGRFREDLYYRLKVFPVEVPPLRDRPEDIPMLVWTFVARFGKELRKEISRIPKETMDALVRYHWPGNVRELKNLIEQAFIVSPGDVLIVRLPEPLHSEAVPGQSLEEMERRHILAVLNKTHWRIKGDGAAAALLGLNPSSLYSRMKKLGIPPRRRKDDIST